MRNQIQRLKKNEKGFTLIELLVVIIILGILAAVVVFAVGGLSDKGNSSACKIDTRTIRTAEEAFYANDQVDPVAYADEDELVPDFLAEASTLHDVVAPGTIDRDAVASGAQTENYDITITAAGAAKGCGTVGHYPGQHTDGVGGATHTDY